MVTIERNTAETEIKLSLNLQGEGKYNIDTGIGFFDHMLELWTRHGFFDLDLHVDGDLYVDGHHTVEDTGIVIGQAINKELGLKKGIKRYGDVILPMDECLVIVAVDLGGRSYYNSDLNFNRENVGNFPVELFDEFFIALTANANFNLHFKMLKGGNTHHMLEACFKGFARAFDKAVQAEPRLGKNPLSTKGRLSEGDDNC